jgi:calcium-dependent protein kinase
MHGLERPIVHRDLKLENIIQYIQNEGSNDAEIILKVTDFGFACEIDPKKPENLSLGSPMYTAPEVIQGLSYDARCDVWSLGVMAYMLLTNKPPFSGSKKEEIYDRTLNNKPDYSSFSRFHDKGHLCTDFVQSCLIKNFHNRPTIA